MSKTITAAGILKEIKIPKGGKMFYLVFQLDSGKIIEAGGAMSQALPPTGVLGKKCSFKYTIKDNYTNISPKWRNKKVVGWEVEELGESVCQPAPMGTTGKHPPPTQNKDLRVSGTYHFPPKDKDHVVFIFRELTEIRKSLSMTRDFLNEMALLIKKDSKNTSEYWEARDKCIVRQACVKAAAKVVSMQDSKDFEEATNATLDMAKEFAKYCNTGE